MSPVSPPPAGARRIRARVEGVVQGVGFRPYVYRLARSLGLGGFVRNDARGVMIEIEGDGAAVDRFLQRLASEAPPLATVERVLPQEIAAAHEREFAIVESAGGSEPNALVSPDAATCEGCLAELFDPADRRFRYPFINCTDCGPRFTIVTGVPYDRSRSTMAGFVMCAACRAEYDAPGDRRFHAQPNACPSCGPAAVLVPGGKTSGDWAGVPDAVYAAARALAGGAIVAVKGLGGFHLACRADDQAAVAALRARKQREDKPFALMVRDLAAARELVHLLSEEAVLLLSRERPVVLCRRRRDAAVAPAVAPTSHQLGLMLPYSPLHHLLLADVGVPLVMTSGNVSDEPIAYGDEDARGRLAGIADCFLLHDRPIHIRTDDSVARVVRHPAGGRPVMLRRSRGYVPASLELPVTTRPLLACGAELKSTFCLARGRRAWLGHHIGDLQNFETLRSFTEGIAHFERLFAVRPEIVAHDLHPDYRSTSYAQEREGVILVGVQHHHAHLAACLAEHGERGPVLGVIFDGAGYGLDGTVWGGELLLGGLDGFARVGHLRAARLPGGDRAAREPWRMACAWLVEALGRVPQVPPGIAGRVEPKAWQAVAELTRSGVAAPVTTSVGRLFDAVAALCGLTLRTSYEGQAAVELEYLASTEETTPYPLRVDDAPVDGAAGGLVLDARDTVLCAARDIEAGVDPSVVSARFHEAMAAAVEEACLLVADRRGVRTVVLSGGVFQNRRLLERAIQRLEGGGLRVLTPERVPPNDGGIAFGQAVIAAVKVESLAAEPG
ncbi:MAG: carbamoyltransferase HypF [Gemmatimonadales bacterium]|nr:carbamoyltransferase HypF [Gemmatimonadales bacterium]